MGDASASTGYGHEADVTTFLESSQSGSPIGDKDVVIDIGNHVADSSASAENKAKGDSVSGNSAELNRFGHDAIAQEFAASRDARGDQDTKEGTAASCKLSHTGVTDNSLDAPPTRGFKWVGILRDPELITLMLAFMVVLAYTSRHAFIGGGYYWSIPIFLIITMAMTALGNTVQFLPL